MFVERKQRLKEYQKSIVRQKGLTIIKNKTIFGL